MTVADAYRELQNSLLGIYGAREAGNIACIVFEDAFQIFGTSTNKSFPENFLSKFQNIKERLAANEPLQYVLGQSDFYGLQFMVNPAVLIPRPETEELVEWMLQSLDKNAPLKILDIGTGSGCIPIALKVKRQKWDMLAVDVSGEALAVARKNAARLQTAIQFLELDILDQSSWQHIPLLDAIVSNPPYIPFAEQQLMPEQVLQFEPNLALFVADADPLIFYRKIAGLAVQKLKPGGSLFFECNEFNAQQILGLLEQSGFSEIELRRDMQGKDRMIRGVCSF